MALSHAGLYTTAGYHKWFGVAPVALGCWFVVLSSVFWPLGHLPTSCAAAAGTIRGVVQREGHNLPEQRMMLIRFGPHQEVQRTPGQTDAQGHFLFDNLEIGSDYTYYVGVRYNEQLYRSAPVTLLSEQPVDVSVDVGMSPAQESSEPNRAPTLYIANHLLVVVRRDTHLEVREAVRLVNAGATPYMEEGAPTSAGKRAFSLPLPPGYSNLSQIQGLAPEHIRTDASALAYAAPLAPGEHRLLFSYSLPWHGDLRTLLLERTLPTVALDLLIEDAHLMATSDLQFGGQVTIDPHTFVHFRGVNIGTQARPWVQLLPVGNRSTSWLSIGAYGVIVGLACLGISLPLSALRDRWHPGTQRASAVYTQEQVRVARKTAQHVLQELALLDEHHAAGKVTTAVQQQRRQEYTEQLLHLIDDFRLV